MDYLVEEWKPLFCPCMEVNWNTRRICGRDSSWYSRREDRCGSAGPRICDVRWKITNGSVRGGILCHNYNGILDHGRICCRIFNMCSCSFS